MMHQACDRPIAVAYTGNPLGWVIGGSFLQLRDTLDVEEHLIGNDRNVKFYIMEGHDYV